MLADISIRRRLLTLGIAGTVAVAALGCASSDDDAASTTTTEAPDDAAATDDTDDTDSGNAGDTAEFCDGVAVFEEIDLEGAETVPPEVVDQFDDLAAIAPDEVADDMDTLAELFRALSEDLDDEESFSEAFGLLLDPEVLEAAESTEAYILDECGIDIDPDDADDDLSGGLTEDEDALDDETSDGLTIDEFEAHLDDAGADAHPWREDLVGTSISSTNGSVDVVLDFPAGVAADDALDACRAADDYFTPLADELTVTVTVDGTDAATLGGAGCEPVG